MFTLIKYLISLAYIHYCSKCTRMCDNPQTNFNNIGSVNENYLLSEHILNKQAVLQTSKVKSTQRALMRFTGLYSLCVIYVLERDKANVIFYLLATN